MDYVLVTFIPAMAGITRHEDPEIIEFGVICQTPLPELHEAKMTVSKRKASSRDRIAKIISLMDTQ